MVHGQPRIQEAGTRIYNSIYLQLGVYVATNLNMYLMISCTFLLQREIIPYQRYYNIHDWSTNPPLTFHPSEIRVSSPPNLRETNGGRELPAAETPTPRLSKFLRLGSLERTVLGGRSRWFPMSFFVLVI